MASNISRKKTPQAPVLGAGDVIGAGDSYLVENLLPAELAIIAFENMQKEVKWQTMQHKGEIGLAARCLLINFCSSL